MVYLNRGAAHLCIAGVQSDHSTQEPPELNCWPEEQGLTMQVSPERKHS